MGCRARMPASLRMHQPCWLSPRRSASVACSPPCSVPTKRRGIAASSASAIAPSPLSLLDKPRSCIVLPRVLIAGQPRRGLANTRGTRPEGGITCARNSEHPSTSAPLDSRWAWAGLRRKPSRCRGWNYSRSAAFIEAVRSVLRRARENRPACWSIATNRQSCRGGLVGACRDRRRQASRLCQEAVSRCAQGAGFRARDWCIPSAVSRRIVAS